MIVGVIDARGQFPREEERAARAVAIRGAKSGIPDINICIIYDI